MNNPSPCSDNSHERDPLDNFCITCHIEYINNSQYDYDYCYDLSLYLKQYRSYNEALACLESGIEFNLQLYDISNKIGDGLRRILKDTEAVNHYQKGLKIKQKNIELLKLKCDIIQLLNKYEEDLICQKQITVINRKDDSFLKGQKGDILQHLNEHDEVLKAYDEMLLQSKEDDERAWNNKGNILLKQKKYDEALKCYDAALKINPQNDAALNGKGNTLLQFKKYDEALKCYDAALKINPQNDAALNGKGRTLIFLNKYEEAMISLEQALKQNPSNKAIKEIESLRSGLKDYIQKQNQLHPKCIDQGIKLIQAGQFEEALQLFDKILAENEDPEAIYYKAMALFHLNRFEEALANCDIAESLGVHPQETKELMDKIFIQMINYQ